MSSIDIKAVYNNDEKEQTLAFLPLYLATFICLPICLFRCLFRCTRPLYQLMTSILNVAR
jgi:hypothetical protein